MAMAMLRVMMIMLMIIWTVDCSADHNSNLDWLHSRSNRCKGGSIADCLSSEFEMDSEINRRILATTSYISYGALQKNTVPCSQRGASYYNCKPGAQANPYSRGCSAITKCKS